MNQDDERELAQERIRRLPGCDAIRVTQSHGEWRAVQTVGVSHGPGAPSHNANDMLVRRPTSEGLVAFFETRGGFGRETEEPGS